MYNNKSRLGALATATAFGVATFFTTSVQAEPGPRLEVTVAAEIENDYTYKSDDKSAEINDLFVTIEPSIDLHLSEMLSIHSDVTIEPVKDPRPFKDREFGDTGIFAETLFLNFEYENVTLFAGKINPPYGTAWDAAPGIYRVDCSNQALPYRGMGVGHNPGNACNGSLKSIISCDQLFC